MIHPSNAIIARADTSIRECIRKMRALNVGSILVVSDDYEMRLVGIFTERDLLKRFDLLESGALWKRPIRTVMSKPVHTLELDKMDEAPSKMLKLGVRHLPIVDSSQQLLGVISMRDLFSALVKENESYFIDSIQLVANLRDISQVSVLSHDFTFHNLLKKVAHTASILGKIRLVSDQQTLLDSSDKKSLLVIDIDGLKSKKWAELLHQINQNARMQHAIVLFDPTHQNQTNRKILEKLAQSTKFSVFSKPVNIFKFLTKIDQLSK
jgi:CBS domain-containing protein